MVAFDSVDLQLAVADFDFVVGLVVVVVVVVGLVAVDHRHY